MKTKRVLLMALIILGVPHYLLSEPGFNGSAPGCSGSGCHAFQNNIVSVVPLNNLQVQVTLTGGTGNMAGELVNSSGTVVAVMNATPNNPFILTAPSEGTFLVNAGYKNPSRRWDSSYVTLQLPPNAPSNLVGQFIPTPLSVQLTWTDNSNNENGFIIERESLGPDAFVAIDTASANANLFIDNTVSYSTYNYRIKAFNTFGQSTYSNVAQIVVPVELTSFNASLKGAGVLLEWVTATEINNMGFEIQRNLSDIWETIGFVDGKGTTSEITNYHFFNDLSEFNYSAKLQYRLKQIDYNGAFSYSEIVEVDFIPENYSLLQNYPNPFNPSTVISYQLPVSGNVTLKVYDVLGKEVATLVDEYNQAGSYEVEFNAAELSTGIYFYELQTGNFNKTMKMILVK
jgi:hypothetical protein